MTLGDTAHVSVTDTLEGILDAHRKAEFVSNPWDRGHMTNTPKPLPIMCVEPPNTLLTKSDRSAMAYKGQDSSSPQEAQGAERPRLWAQMMISYETKSRTHKM